MASIHDSWNKQILDIMDKKNVSRKEAVKILELELEKPFIDTGEGEDMVKIKNKKAVKAKRKVA